jgi:hypothetical protein
MQATSVLVSSQELDAAHDSAQFIMAHLDAYTEDSLSRYEVAEIAAVERDIRAVRSESDAVLFVEEVRQLETDWSRLMELDQMLGKEHLV